MKKNVLITGGAGFIGTHLVNELLRDDLYRITVVDNESTGKFTSSQSSVNYIHADIADLATMRSILSGIDIIVHLAADTEVIQSIKNPSHNFSVNVVGTFNLLKLACEANVSAFINASTGGAILGEATTPIHEEIAAKPLSPYGASKLATEGYCSAFEAVYGLRTVSLRFSNVYGPGSQHKKSVIAHFLKQILKGQNLIVYGDGSQIRDYLYVTDLVKGIDSAMQKSVSGVFQLGSGIPTSLQQLIQIIRDTVGQRQFNICYEPPRKGEIHQTWCNINKARTELSFNPMTSLTEGIFQCWEWFKNVAHNSTLSCHTD